MEGDDDFEGMDDAFHALGDDDLYAQLEEMLPPGGQVLFGDIGHPRAYQVPLAFTDAVHDSLNDFSSKCSGLDLTRYAIKQYCFHA